MKLSKITKTAQMLYDDDDTEDPQFEDPGSDADYDVTANRPVNRGPTLGTLEHAIMVDQRLSAFEKKYALRMLQIDTNYASPSTPVSSLLGSLGGGALGAIVARLLGLGGIGMGIAAIGGYGLGKVIADYYLSKAPSGSRLQVL